MSHKGKDILSIKSWSRLAGLIGVIVLVCGSYTHSVNSGLIDYGSASQTAENILASENSYRVGFMSGLIMETAFVFYAFLLYRIFKPVNESCATLMLILALVPAPIFFVNQLNHLSVLMSAKEGALDSILFYLSVHKNGGFIISIFFGLWLFPLGYLVYKSTFAPKFLGVLLMIGCFGYLTNCVQGILFPGSESSLWKNPALVITHISEILFMLWLLIAGVNSEEYSQLLASKESD